MADILLVEDDACVLAATRRALVHLGHRVLTAGDAVAALQAGHGERPVDLLLTDVVLPGMDGCSLARRMQEEDPRLSVLLCSGHPAEAIERFGPMDERWACLRKPYSVTQLGNAVARLLPDPREADHSRGHVQGVSARPVSPDGSGPLERRR